jgi:UDP-N-acetylmuramoylalanine--D-glutamate ligase
MIMELKDKKVLVVGLARTGEALCRFLLRRGARVRVTEKKTLEALGRRAALLMDRGVEFETGGHKLETFLNADLVVLSPGVPPLSEAGAAAEKGVLVISEIELAYAFLKGRIVGITGSNGKSTTTTLAHRILEDSGLKAFAAGNIGTPLISFADRSRDDDIYVTEISSFQLNAVRDFKVAVSAFLNISLNHLDWHRSFENYYEAKKKLVLAQVKGDAAILNRDDAEVWALRSEARSKVYAFSRRRKVAKGCFLQDGRIVIRDRAETPLMKASEVRLPGLHNLENVMAAALVGHLFGVPPDRMRATIKEFKGLEHRLENVLTIKGVRFVNDSKATTVEAAIKALESFDRKIVLILGGKDKGSDFTLLRKPLEKKVRKVLLIGQAAGKIRAAVKGTVPLETAATFKELVRKGFEAASPGDVVLLAPACTSWDMFNNFEERGRTFKREVKSLARKMEGR